MTESLGVRDYFLGFDSPLEQNEEGEEDDRDDMGLDPSKRPRYFLLRVGVFLLLSWASLVLILSILLAAPLFTGRKIISLVKVPLSHDFLLWICGCYAIVGTGIAVKTIFFHFERKTLWKIVEYAMLAVKIGILTICFTVIAYLFAFSFATVSLFPMMSVNKKIVFGIDDIFLTSPSMILWRKIITDAEPGTFFYPLRMELQLMYANGRNVHLRRILRNCVIPAFVLLSLYFLGPAIVINLFVPVVCRYVLGFSIMRTISLCQYLMRFTHTVLLGLFLVFFITRKIYRTVFDRVFVVDRVLQNHEDLE